MYSYTSAYGRPATSYQPYSVPSSPYSQQQAPQPSGYTPYASHNTDASPSLQPYTSHGVPQMRQTGGYTAGTPTYQSAANPPTPGGLTNSTTSYSRDPLSSSNVYGSDRVPGGTRVPSSGDRGGPSWDSSQTSDRSNQPVRQPGSSGTSDSLAASGALAQQRAVFASNYSSAQQYLAATAASGRVGATDLSGSAAGQGQGGAPVRGGEGLSLSTINTRSSGDVRGEVGGSTRASASELNAAPPLHVAPPPRQYPGGAQPYAPTGRFSDMYGSNRVDPSERATVSTPTTAASQTPGGPPGQPGSSGGAGTGGAGTSGAGLGFSALGMREAHRGPLVSSHADRMRPIQVPDFEKERLRSRVDELQTLVDRQNGDLQRRNDELLDLQRNHEAFREKFIMFREGMRSKTDESDARFRKLEAELKLSQEELARYHSEMGKKMVGDDALKNRNQQLEAQVAHEKQGYEKQVMDLREELAVARNNSNEKELAQKESLLRDLRTRVENQAEFIRSQNAKMADLEGVAQQAQTLASERARAEEQVQDMQRRRQDMEARHAGQAAALNQHAGKLVEVTKTLDEERQTVGALRTEMEKLVGKLSESEKGAESKGAEGARQQQRIQMLEQQMQRAGATETDLRAKLQTSLAAPKADPSQPGMIQDLQARLSQQAQAVEAAGATLAARERAAQDLGLQVQQLQEEAGRQRKAGQHEAAVFTSTRQALSKEVDGLKNQLQEAQGAAAGGEALSQRAGQAERSARDLSARVNQLQEENGQLGASLTAARENARILRESAQTQSNAAHTEARVQQLQEDLGQANSLLAHLQNQLRSRPPASAAPQQSQSQMTANLLRSRDVLLTKLIGNWQKQALGRSFAAWLRSIEAFKMDRILMESDKYMSMDSSIDDLLNDALSKRRARSIVASSVSLGGSSIDDDMFQAAAAGHRPVSGGSVTSYGGGSSVSGSLEWMV